LKQFASLSHPLVPGVRDSIDIEFITATPGAQRRQPMVTEKMLIVAVLGMILGKL